MSTRELEHALEVRNRVASTQTVTRTNGPAAPWIFDAGELRNEKADFFRVAGFRTPSGVEEILFEQRETALVGLLVSRETDHLRVLVNARAEPGLHGSAQFSTTIQSTPSNYERRHGGAATPFVDEILNPPVGGVVIHDSLQYDWAQYYHAKTKRFRIVEVPQELPASEPLLWVDLRDLRTLLAEDYLVTGDLRVAASYLEHHLAPTADAVGDAHGTLATAELTKVPIESLSRWDVGPDGIMDRDGVRDIVWVLTRSESREVSQWLQPLMELSAPVELRLAGRKGESEWEFAIARGTTIGLDGVDLWFPAELDQVTRDLATISLSAEGGRFFQLAVHASVVEVPHRDDGARWVTRQELEALAATPCATSIELRLLLSLVQLSGPQP